MDPRVSVVVLAYDEEANIEPTAREIHATLAALGEPFELVLVDDGSRDRTGALADALARDLTGTRVIHHGTNLGLGGGYRTGFESARGELLTFFPADGQFPADLIPRFVALMPGRDLVLGYLPEARPSLVGRTLSACERLLFRLMFGPLPRFQGIFMIRRATLPRLALASSGRGWGILLEMIVRARAEGLEIAGAPTTVRPRRSGASKVQNLRTVWSNLRQAMALRRRLRRGRPR